MSDPSPGTALATGASAAVITQSGEHGTQPSRVRLVH